MTPLRCRKECAAFFRCSVETFDRNVRQQLPPPRMVGRRPFWLQAWLDAWVTGDTDPRPSADGLPPTSAPPSGAPVTKSRDLRQLAERLALTPGQRVAFGLGSLNDVESVRRRDERQAARAAAVERLSGPTAPELTEDERRQLRRLLTPAQRRTVG